jgi:hypothetical protein
MRTSLMARLLVVMFFAFGLLANASHPQSTNAAVGGQITDEQGRVVPGVTILLTNLNTGVTYEAKTNGDGFYNAPSLPPGIYRANVTKDGFKNIVKGDIELHVQDVASINFELQIGSVNETVTVQAGGLVMNTTDAAVSTVVDRQFAENLPLNGRSFQSLIELAPGVVLTPTTGIDYGQFSINGQRSTANYWMVDGVSANIASTGTGVAGSGPGGAAGNFSALGGTNSLVSVDAMQEFRIQTSTYAPEFGRTPGGQISILTRSGTNQWHGTLFEYLRNDVLDANDWFADEAGIPKPPERQNDFGGTVGGPVFKDKTFFFFSYEGLRLRLPEVGLTTVPDLAARQNAVPAVQPYLNAFPKPSPGGKDHGDGTADASYSFSNKGTLDAYSIRVDHRFNGRFSLFGRYNYSPSQLVQRGVDVRPLSTLVPININTLTTTVGSTWTITPTILNDLRFNYSRVTAASSWSLDTFGGAVVPPVNILFPSPFTTQNSVFIFGVIGLSHGFLTDGRTANEQPQQVNLIDNLAIVKGTHSLKVGVDYRRLFPKIGQHGYGQAYFFGSVAAAESGNFLFDAIDAGRIGTVLFQNFGAFAQDTWMVNSRLTITYGVRWDVDVSPSSTSGPALQSVTGFNLNDLSKLAIAPSGAPVYRTPYGNVAPRLGVAYQVRRSPNWQTTLRGGFGTFFDLVSPEINSALGATYPFYVLKFNFAGGSFPLDPNSAAAAPPSFTISNFAGGTQAAVFDPNMKLPYTLEWNVALEQALGSQQAISASYVGAAGRRLVQSTLISPPNTNFIGNVDLIGNTARSDYDALQVQFQRRLSRGLQALASYTWSHSIDNASIGSFSGGSGSSNTLVPGIDPRQNRGPSDFDIRNTLSAGVTYDVPAPEGNFFTNLILKGWSTDNFVLARSAPPVNVFNSGAGFTLLGASTEIRPNVVPGIPLYLYGPQYPGGKAINNTPGAVAGGCPDGSQSVGPFCPPATGQQGNLGRNALRGFGATQWDFAVHRDFPIHESLKMQFRAEMFNVLNHPNFGPPVSDLSNTSQFGQSIQMLGRSLGQNSNGAGLNALHQIGGPRSIQFALKLSF